MSFEIFQASLVLSKYNGGEKAFLVNVNVRLSVCEIECVCEWLFQDRFYEVMVT